VRDLAVASPATVSRCGMLYAEPSNVGVRAIMTSWANTLPKWLTARVPVAAETNFKIKKRAARKGQKKTKDVQEAVEMSQEAQEAQAERELQMSTHLSGLVEWLLIPSITFTSLYLGQHHFCKISELWLVFEACIAAFTDPAQQTDDDDAPTNPVHPPTNMDELKTLVDSLFVFSTVWSVGACVDGEGRDLFDAYLRFLASPTEPETAPQLILDAVPNAYLGLPLDDSERDASITMEGLRRKLGTPLPAKGSLYDYHFAVESMSWTDWMDSEFYDDTFAIPEECEFNKMVIPTIDSVRHGALTKMLLTSNSPVLLGGPTGTSKTVIVKELLLNGMPDNYISIFLNFSARTSANHTQGIIDGKLDKRYKGVFGPPFGKNSIFFVDDLNMPLPEEYGAQPPLELLRQWFVDGGWYDLKTKEFMNLIDIQFVAAMGPPGGGRTHVCLRTLRHFNLISVPELSQDSLKHIFSTIVSWYLNKCEMGVRGLCSTVVDATIDVYNTIRTTMLYLSLSLSTPLISSCRCHHRPTPAKSHYTFNLRDLSKVFQGLLMFNPSSLKTSDVLVQGWLHESQRMFRDRLIADDDREWFDTYMQSKIEGDFKLDYRAVLTAGLAEKPAKDVPVSPSDLLFGDLFNDGAVGEYKRVTKYQTLIEGLEESLFDYNSMGTGKRMDLVLFQFAVGHILKIARILRQAEGNALLIGLGGSGRQSLTRLAAFCMEYDVVQIEVTKAYTVADWKQDLRDCFLKAGVQNKKVVFLFSDTQIVFPSQMEDINNILNTGDVPNLFAPDETQQIVEDLQPQIPKGDTRADTRLGVMDFFTD
ncbi:dynein heavy chain 1, axonemal, partial [Kipferlia bialata]